MVGRQSGGLGAPADDHQSSEETGTVFAVSNISSRLDHSHVGSNYRPLPIQRIKFPVLIDSLSQEQEPTMNSFTISLPQLLNWQAEQVVRIVHLLW